LAGKIGRLLCCGVERSGARAILTHHGLSLEDVDWSNVNWSLSRLDVRQVDAVIVRSAISS